MAVILSSDKGTGLNGRIDTLAQSFLIDRPVYVTKIDLFFSEKDGNRPVEISLRKIENDSPSANVIPNSLVAVDTDDILISSNSLIATTITFPQPVLLESGNYCFVLSSDTKNNKVYTAALGGEDIATGAIISKQPYSGAMFSSSNGDFWTVDQTRDVKFKLYVAKFTSTSGQLDLKIKDDGLDKPTNIFVEENNIKSYTGKKILKISQIGHGLQNGHYVRFNALLNDFEYLANANAEIKINGIPYENLSNVILPVSNVTYESYTLELSTNTAQTANIIGGNFPDYGAVLTTMIPYSTIVTGIAETVPLRTSSYHFIKTTDQSLTAGSFEQIQQGEIRYYDTQVIVDEYNRQVSMSGADSLGYRLALQTLDDYLSPMIDLSSTSLLLVSPDINDTSSADVMAIDYEDIANTSSNVSFVYTDTVGYVYCSDTDVKSNIRTMKKGAYVTLSGTGQANNSGTFRIVNIAEDGSYFQVPNVENEPIGNAITITYNPLYVTDQASYGTTTRAKYITRKIDLKNLSTAFNIRMTVSKPAGSDIEVYFKSQNSNLDTGTFEEKEYRKLDLGVIPITTKGEYLEIESTIDGLLDFDAFVFKIIMKSNNIAIYPEVRDLRIIALE